MPATLTLLGALAAALPTPLPPAATRPDSTERAIRYEFTVRAPVARVWEAWTTPAGIATFFAPAAEIELRTFGKYDILFMPDSAPGRRGADGNVVLAVQPERMLTTTWNAPLDMPEVRRNRTVLVVRLAPVGDSATVVTITNSGYGTGAEWDRAYGHFAVAWRWVAAALQHRFEVGPLDFRRPPDLRARMGRIASTR